MTGEIIKTVSGSSAIGTTWVTPTGVNDLLLDLLAAEAWS
jgi:hypothetical protein